MGKKTLYGLFRTGDIDLRTIKGLKALRESDAICVPTKMKIEF